MEEVDSTWLSLRWCATQAIALPLYSRWSWWAADLSLNESMNKANRTGRELHSAWNNFANYFRVCRDPYVDLDCCHHLPHSFRSSWPASKPLPPTTASWSWWAISVFAGGLNRWGNFSPVLACDSTSIHYQFILIVFGRTLSLLGMTAYQSQSSCSLHL